MLFVVNIDTRWLCCLKNRMVLSAAQIVKTTFHEVWGKVKVPSARFHKEEVLG